MDLSDMWHLIVDSVFLHEPDAGRLFPPLDLRAVPTIGASLVALLCLAFFSVLLFRDRNLTHTLQKRVGELEKQVKHVHDAHRSYYPSAIVFLRHGESEANVDPSLYSSKGDPYIELTPTGVLQAKQAGQRLAKVIHKLHQQAPADANTLDELLLLQQEGAGAHQPATTTNLQTSATTLTSSGPPVTTNKTNTTTSTATSCTTARTTGTANSSSSRNIKSGAPVGAADVPPNELQLQVQKMINASTTQKVHKKVFLYCSPYVRTRQTAQHVAESLQEQGIEIARVIEDPRIRERELPFGWTGEETSMSAGRFFSRPRGGESSADVFDRVSLFFHTIWRDFRSHPEMEGQVALIVTHGLAMRVALMKWMNWNWETFLRMRNPENCEALILQGDEHKTSSGVGGDKGSSSRAADQPPPASMSDHGAVFHAGGLTRGPLARSDSSEALALVSSRRTEAGRKRFVLTKGSLDVLFGDPTRSQTGIATNSTAGAEIGRRESM
ncbi:unnamed protein product [Amoebophrya sp. A120]|nr:unnamed protein product [Amoebophrya sp. A120]|eukprot:GSA120T00021722001.1